jgi:hypothetical protein
VLKRALAIYRMVFGQPQQDDLLEYLQEHVDQALFERLKGELQIDLLPSVRRPAGGMRLFEPVPLDRTLESPKEHGCSGLHLSYRAFTDHLQHTLDLD